ncbi:MAG: SDR family oxidoreductase [Gammaproteobacteria bacterium]|nr:SDR family oxidoreductase [Gammaproteobacteria bacterium]
MKKVALITGASRGIGRAAALAFAAKGYDLVLTARADNSALKAEHSLTDANGNPLPGSLETVANEVRELGRKVWCLPMDLLDSESVQQAGEQALNLAGQVDVLINNAVYQGKDLNALLKDLTVETLERVAQAYLVSPFLLTRFIGDHMQARGSGVVINITSGAGESNPPVSADRGGWGYAYGAGKAAVSRLSGVIKAEWGKRGIRAYTVNPGVVTTEALRATIGDQGIQALGAGSAPPEVPAQVLAWLACDDRAGEFQKRTIHAQPFALEQQIVTPWSSPTGG